MLAKELVFSLLLVLQVCDTVLAQTPAPDPPGILQKLTDRVRAAKMKVWNFTESLYGFAETYYEDNIQPLTGRYTQWASGVKSSMLDKIQKTIENYVPTVANQTF